MPAPSLAASAQAAQAAAGRGRKRRLLLALLLLGVVVVLFMGTVLKIRMPTMRATKALMGSWAIGKRVYAGGGGGGGGVGKGGRGLVDGPVPTPKPQPPVPNIVHFIFGLEETFGHIKWGMIHYLAVLGAHLHIQPEEIRLHHQFEPSGPWWECARPLLKLVKEGNITEVWGRPQKMRVAHKADIIRMRIMREEGGIYLDSDVIPLRSFEELRRYNLSMGLEGEEGLCNAVLVGAPNTTFINRWWEEYKTFDAEKQWAYHSVLVPRQLQRHHPREVTVLSDRAFFTPMWTQLRAMYDKDDGYDYHANFAVHLWTSADERQRNRLGSLTPAAVFEGEGSFHRRMRAFLAEALERGELCDYVVEETRKLVEASGGNFTRPTVLKKKEGEGERER
jgi:hypothetical protein